MESASNAIQKNQKNLLKAILSAGLLAGFLDASAASIQYYIKTGKSPVIVFKYIASAVIGKAAYSGGSEIAVFGLIFHFLIALLFTVFFFLIYPWISRFSKNIIVNAIVFGLFTWAVMNLLVVPMTKIAKRPFDMSQALLAMAILIVCIGLPVAALAHNYYGKRD